MSFSGGEHQSKRVRVQGGVISTICHFRFWHKADIANRLSASQPRSSPASPSTASGHHKAPKSIPDPRAANRGAPKSELWVGSGKSDAGRENRRAAAAACPELNLGNELSYDAASEMACGCFNEFDEIDVVISLIRDCADHNKRYIALVTNLSDRRTFHFYTQCFW